MSLSIGNTSLYNLTTSTLETSNNTNSLENSLNGNLEQSTDEELMDVCKSFESYLVEQVIKEMKKSVPDSDEGEYTKMFGDVLVEQYATTITEQSNLGVAQMLYDSMKRE